jgi:hypothetical protein
MGSSVDVLWQLYSASHHNRIDTRIFSSCAVQIGPPIQHGRSHKCDGLGAGLNLSLATIQKKEGVAALVREELMSGKFGNAQRGAGRFSHEAVKHVARV